MKTLWLLRHAKASQGGDGLADRDRPLNARGRDAAARIGRHLAEREVCPELVLCSSALRTRETVELDAVAQVALAREIEVVLVVDRKLGAEPVRDELDRLSRAQRG